MKAIGKKMDRYKNPWLELKIQYGQNKGKLYNEECDRFMVRLPVTLSSSKLYLFSSLSNNLTDHLVLSSFISSHRYAWFTRSGMATGMS